MNTARQHTTNITPINRDSIKMDGETVNRSKWAWSLKLGSSSEKSVLVALAECASSKTHLAFPSIAHVCEMTELNRKTVIPCISSLLEKGLIEDTGSTVGSTGQIIVYRIMFGNSPKNGTIKESQKRNSTKNGTVPVFPDNSTVFSSKESQFFPVTVPKTVHVSPIEPLLTPINPKREGADASPKAQPAQARATALPVDWSLPQEWAEWALAERTDWTASHAELTARVFADYWHGKGGKDARKADWFATWRNWVRRENLASKPKQQAQPSKHNGFAQRDYSAGINPDGSF